MAVLSASRVNDPRLLPALGGGWQTEKYGPNRVHEETADAAQ